MTLLNMHTPLPLDWRKLPVALEECKDTVIIIVGALTAVFTTIDNAQGVAQLIGWAIALILLGVGARCISDQA